jgi:ATP-dependent RNA helicase DDX18/HAS1
MAGVLRRSQVEDLARLSFKRQPLYVGIDDSKAVSTREGLEQGYCVVPSAQRFLLLFTFLKKNLQKKVLASRPSDGRRQSQHNAGHS